MMLKMIKMNSISSENSSDKITLKYLISLLQIKAD